MLGRPRVRLRRRSRNGLGFDFRWLSRDTKHLGDYYRKVRD